ncbi:MAG: M14-type cytosolic carboxypeptidase [Pirellulales bacterium]|nr:M14-type cytosolic carboxypeptidase [Pirellulales bacterium]
MLVYCASIEAAEQQATREFEFSDAGVRIDSDFDGGRLSNCRQLDDNRFEITIEPENFPINDSAWYAFRITAKEAKEIALKFVYLEGSHRYHPWLSSDRKRWKTVNERAYIVEPHSARATLNVSVGPDPLWIAAQPLMTEKDIAKWTERLAKHEFVKRGVIGRSVRGNEIESFEISGRGSKNYVYVISRQHPPEVTGHQGMMDLIDVVCGDSPLARRFRDHFTTICVPTVNPDGVADGNWRHNARGIDLNRDWGLFRQPETQAMRDMMLATLERDGARPFLFLDYHSTYNDMYYTQSDEEQTFPPQFTHDWLTAIQRRMPNEKVIRDSKPGGSPYTSRKWVYRTFGIPSITVEFGDNASTDHIRRVSRIAAEEMMIRLLDEVDPR